MGPESPANLEAMRRQLPDIGDGIAGGMQTLYNDPRPDAAELMAIRLDGARRHVLRLAEGLRQEARE